MIKNLTQFKAVIQDIECVFHFDQNCPTNIAKEALFACIKWVGQIEDEAAKAANQNEISCEETKPAESVEVVDG